MSYSTINYLLFEKRRELDSELLNSFIPHITTKMLSFYDNGSMINYINDYLNRYGNIFQSKEEQFKFYENLIPVQRKKYINYIKKPVSEPPSELSAIPEFYSRRELDMMDDMRKYPHE